MAERWTSPNRIHDRATFFKYTKAATAKIILASRKIRWNSPVEFNDPFDVTQELRLNFTNDELNEALNRRWADAVRNGNPDGRIRHPAVLAMLRLVEGWPPERRAEFADQIERDGPNSTPGELAAFEQLKEMWREMVPTFRVLCLTETAVSVPMWAHYADNHTGVVLEFAAVDELDAAFLMAKKVTYQDSPPAIAGVAAWIECLMGERDYMELFTEIQYVKTTPWSYEKEWRISSMKRPGETGTYSDYGFHPKELVAIYFGSRCSSSDRQDLCSLLTHGLEHVQPYHVIPDAQSGNLQIRAGQN